MKDIRQYIVVSRLVFAHSDSYLFLTNPTTNQKTFGWDNAVFEGDIRGYFCGYLGTFDAQQ